MKKLFLPLATILTLTMGCNNSSKDSVEKADSANEARADTAMGTIDEAGSSFLVNVANNGMAEVQLASTAEQKATYPDVKSFAAMLYHDHSAVNETVKNLAASKNVVLPAAVSDEKKNDITNFQTKAGKELDKEFVTMMIKSHTSSIESFEKIRVDSKDADVRSFAEQTLPALRAHLDSAKALDKKYW